jgi:hypothetical protein
MNIDKMLYPNAIAPLEKKENLKKQKRINDMTGENSRPCEAISSNGSAYNVNLSQHTFNSDEETSSYHQTKSQPIYFTKKRTDSEIQFYADTLLAEYREYCMFHRVHGRALQAKDKQVSSISQHRQEFDDENIWTRWMDERSYPESYELNHNSRRNGLAFQKGETDTFLSCPLPSLISLLDCEPQSMRISYDEDDGIFDLEL